MRSKIASGWTQSCAARNRAGFPVVAYSEDAVQWCLVGSIGANKNVRGMSNMNVRMEVYRIIADLLANRNEPPSMELFNDKENRTKEEVLELLDEAISVASVGGFE